MKHTNIDLMKADDAIDSLLECRPPIAFSLKLLAAQEDLQSIVGPVKKLRKQIVDDHIGEPVMENGQPKTQNGQMLRPVKEPAEFSRKMDELANIEVEYSPKSTILMSDLASAYEHSDVQPRGSDIKALRFLFV